MLLVCLKRSRRLKAPRVRQSILSRCVCWMAGSRGVRARRVCFSPQADFPNNRGRARDSGARTVKGPRRAKSRSRLVEPQRLLFDTSSARAHQQPNAPARRRQPRRGTGARKNRLRPELRTTDATTSRTAPASTTSTEPRKLRPTRSPAPLIFLRSSSAAARSPRATAFPQAASSDRRAPSLAPMLYRCHYKASHPVYAAAGRLRRPPSQRARLQYTLEPNMLRTQ